MLQRNIHRAPDGVNSKDLHCLHPVLLPDSDTLLVVDRLPFVVLQHGHETIDSRLDVGDIQRSIELYETSAAAYIRDNPSLGLITKRLRNEVVGVHNSTPEHRMGITCVSPYVDETRHGRVSRRTQVTDRELLALKDGLLFGATRRDESVPLARAGRLIVLDNWHAA